MENLDLFFKAIKKEFFSLRNGMVADNLKKYFSSDSIIFGLMIPQIKEISERYPKSIELGFKLWEDKKCRESRLLALYLLPKDKIDKDEAKKLFKEVATYEEAELLSFKILRYLDFADNLLKELSEEDLNDPLLVYNLSMFKKNLNQR